MNIQSVVLRRLLCPMKEPFITSFGLEEDKDVILVELTTPNTGATGFAECTASSAPLYCEETNTWRWHVMERFLIPVLFQLDFSDPADLHNRVREGFARSRETKWRKRPWRWRSGMLGPTNTKWRCTSCLVARKRKFPSASASVFNAMCQRS